jgi:hypothetical protein
MSSGISTNRRRGSVSSDDLDSRSRKNTTRLQHETPIQIRSLSQFAADVEGSKSQNTCHFELAAKEAAPESNKSFVRSKISDPGLGQLSRLSPEIRDLIYDLIPVEDVPEITSPCQPRILQSISTSLSRDLHRSHRLCSHVDFTLTCDSSCKDVVEDCFGWCHARLARSSGSRSYDEIHRVEIVVKNSAEPDLPTLCYQIVNENHNIQGTAHIWFDGARAGHAQLCKLGDQLVGSFGAAAACITAIIQIMCISTDQDRDVVLNTPSIRANIDKLSKSLRYYAAAQAEDLKGPAGKLAQCIIVLVLDDSIEYHFDPTARQRLQEALQVGSPHLLDGLEPISDCFDWYHEFFELQSGKRWHLARVLAILPCV